MPVSTRSKTKKELLPPPLIYTREEEEKPPSSPIRHVICKPSELPIDPYVTIDQFIYELNDYYNISRSAEQRPYAFRQLFSRFCVSYSLEFSNPSLLVTCLHKCIRYYQKFSWLFLIISDAFV